MKRLYLPFCLLLVISFFACKGEKRQEPLPENTPTPTDISAKTERESTPDIGEAIYGDFDGNGTFEYALVKQIESKSQKEEYVIYFLDEEEPFISLGCCLPILIAEGDLDGDGSCEISIFQAPENGCTYLWRTISYKDKKVRDVLEPFLIPTACERKLSFDELHDIVTLEDCVVYYKETDLNDLSVHKKEAVLLTK